MAVGNVFRPCLGACTPANMLVSMPLGKQVTTRSLDRGCELEGSGWKDEVQRRIFQWSPIPVDLRSIIRCAAVAATDTTSIDEAAAVRWTIA